MLSAPEQRGRAPSPPGSQHCSPPQCHRSPAAISVPLAPSRSPGMVPPGRVTAAPGSAPRPAPHNRSSRPGAVPWRVAVTQNLPEISFSAPSHFIPGVKIAGLCSFGWVQILSSGNLPTPNAHSRLFQAVKAGLCQAQVLILYLQLLKYYHYLKQKNNASCQNQSYLFLSLSHEGKK